MNPKKKILQTRKDLYTYYRVSDKVFATWLRGIQDRLGKINGRVFTPKQIEIILDEFGEPNG